MKTIRDTRKRRNKKETKILKKYRKNRQKKRENRKENIDKPKHEHVKYSKEIDDDVHQVETQ